MTSAQLRQSFLDFFAAHGHTLVPSSSLLPDSPGLLFTNAGMNQFVPIFLGDRAPDVSKWAGAKPSKDTRAADTQKCIRAGGKHNDLEDVGFDTYHHTLFEMLGNWSFGDYFKKESLTWGWELLTKVWGIPPKRLFATVYAPKAGDPSEFDHEAAAIWKELFRAAGLDPAVHIVNGNRKDNFWQMGDTGPCGPCSEIHFNLLPSDDESAGRALVNSSSPRCIEIWNHVFIQFNANVDGTFSPLAAKHVDTGMGFERVAGIMSTTKAFTDFSAEPSNYAADVFAPLFAKIAELSGRTYRSTVPTRRVNLSDHEQNDIAFRVIADHARCVSCAIADGILPGNKGRYYVIRRILRRGILYGKKIGLSTGFFEQLVPAVVESLGNVFPELNERQEIIRRAIRSEEESFGRTIGRGIERYEQWSRVESKKKDTATGAIQLLNTIPGSVAFELYATYGFPLDMTQLLAAEEGFSVDVAGFNAEMEKHKEISDQAEQEIIVAATEGEATNLQPTKFLGYTQTHAHGQLLEVIRADKDTFLVFDQTPFYAEMGGQAGDAGTALINGKLVTLTDCVKDKAGRHLHRIAEKTQNPEHKTQNLAAGATAELAVEVSRRRAISRHHSATHLLHWALRKVLGTHVRQAGTHKTPERLRFDFSHFEAVTHAQLLEIEQLVNERVIDNAKVETYETEFDKKPEGTLAFFGDKYGKIVRVVDIGGYSRELCGGTHVATTGEIGIIKIVAEMAIAAGTRRIEAVAGQLALDFISHREAALAAVNAKLNAGTHDVAQKLDALLGQQKETEKQLKVFQQKTLTEEADKLILKMKTVEHPNYKVPVHFVSGVIPANSPEDLRYVGSYIVSQLPSGPNVAQIGAVIGQKSSLVVFCSGEAIQAGANAGTLVSYLSAQIGGKGGGKPDFAMGGGKDSAKLAETLKL